MIKKNKPYTAFGPDAEVVREYVERPKPKQILITGRNHFGGGTTEPLSSDPEVQVLRPTETTRCPVDELRADYGGKPVDPRAAEKVLKFGERYGSTGKVPEFVIAADPNERALFLNTETGAYTDIDGNPALVNGAKFETFSIDHKTAKKACENNTQQILYGPSIHEQYEKAFKARLAYERNCEAKYDRPFPLQRKHNPAPRENAWKTTREGSVLPSKR